LPRRLIILLILSNAIWLYNKRAFVFLPAISNLLPNKGPRRIFPLTNLNHLFNFWIFDNLY
jgi:hypothetical protein